MIRIIIGTGVMWLLGLLVVNPLATYFAKRKFCQKYEGKLLPQDENIISAQFHSIYNRTYIITDVIVLSFSGFLMGLLVGWFFIGISWRARDWPGLITFIGLSVLGSFIHG